MGSEESGDCVYQQQRNGSSNSISDKVAAMSIDPFCSYGPYGWDRSQNLGSSSMVSPHNEFANPHYSAMLENHTMGNSSHLVHFPSDSGLVDLVPKTRSFGSGDLPEMVSSFGNCQNLENGALGVSPSTGKRKRKLSAGVSFKNAEIGEPRDPSRDTVKLPIGDDQNKNVGRNSCHKQAVKQAKDDDPVDEEPPKENYVHVRAKRGQATNSHSLAERVRREKISERMKLLQELVPGCNKITGKAVMLDEIINYVQSLQQQVEFLSMKLATVNPELNVDIDLLSKDSRGNNINAPIICPGLSSSHPFPGNFQGMLSGTPGTTPPCHHLPQNIWNNELQGILQMGFDYNPSISSLGPDGPSKMEQ